MKQNTLFIAKCVGRYSERILIGLSETHFTKLEMQLYMDWSCKNVDCYPHKVVSINVSNKTEQKRYVMVSHFTLFFFHIDLCYWVSAHTVWRVLHFYCCSLFYGCFIQDILLLFPLYNAWKDQILLVWFLSPMLQR